MREFFYRLETYNDERKAATDQLNEDRKDRLELTRWSVFQIIRSFGSKVSSPYQLMQLPWDPGPSKKPDIDLFKNLPEKLK